MQISYVEGDTAGEYKPDCTSGCCQMPLLPMIDPRPQPSRSRSAFSVCHSNFVATTVSSIFPNPQFTNHESVPPLDQSFHKFFMVCPQYSNTHTADRIRETEYRHLSQGSHTCLDYIGVGLFSYSQLQNHGWDASQSQTALSSMSSPPPFPVPKPEFPFFSLSYKTGSLKTQLLLGGGADGWRRR